MEDILQPFYFKRAGTESKSKLRGIEKYVICILLSASHPFSESAHVKIYTSLTLDTHFNCKNNTLIHDSFTEIQWHCSSCTAAELMETLLSQFTEEHWASASQMCLLFRSFWQTIAELFSPRTEKLLSFVGADLKANTVWLVILFLEDTPYCKTDYEVVKLDLLLNSSAE